MAGEKRIKKWQIIVLIAISLSYLGLKIWQLHWPDAYLELDGQKLHVLVADNIGHQIKGLGGRDSLGKYDGMIFVYNNYSRSGFVMRDMRFAIDIVWFKDGRVIDIAPNAPVEPGVPEKQLRVYYPRAEANLVLELPAGWADKHWLKIGDELKVISH